MQAYSCQTETGDHVSSLAKALKNNELVLHYQPRIDCSSGAVCVFEALVRWERAGVGLLYPQAFMQAATEHALNYLIDLWVFERSCRDLKWLRTQFGGQIKIAINISSHSCESVYISQRIIDICEACNLSMTDFIFEIVIDHGKYEPHKVSAFCETLISQGAGICVDESRASSSPLINLERLPTQYLKIDRFLVENIGKTERCDTIIRHCIKLSRTLNITAFAVGVESEHQYAFLKHEGCIQIQGYHISRPGDCHNLLKNKANLEPQYRTALYQ